MAGQPGQMQADLGKDRPALTHMGADGWYAAWMCATFLDPRPWSPGVKQGSAQWQPQSCVSAPQHCCYAGWQLPASAAGRFLESPFEHFAPTFSSF